MRPGFLSKERGFSLVEVMVGLTVGLITVMIIGQVFSNFEQQKRVTTSSTDAQSAGLVSLVQIEQDARSAGAGFVESEIFDCANTYSYYAGPPETSPVPGFGGNFAPVVITDGGATGSDTILFRIGSDFLGAIPTTISETMPQPSSELKVTRSAGFEQNQIVLVVQGGNCTAMQITQVQASNHLQHNSGVNAPWNPNVPYQTAEGWPAYTVGAKIMTVGAISMKTYSVNANNQLQSTSQSAAASTTEILNGDIVSLQAQYGVSDNASNSDVSSWEEPTGDWAAGALSVDKIKRIRAIRVAVVARSAKREGADITGQCTQPVSAAVNNGPCLWRDADAANNLAPVLDLSGNANWRKYRYRVFQTIIPLRNMIWAQLS